MNQFQAPAQPRMPRPKPKQVDKQDSIRPAPLFPNLEQRLNQSPSVIPVTVMFVDLRQFTALVEDWPPNQIIQQLNAYFSAMTAIIVARGGVVDKYMGDAIMAYFECDDPLQYSYTATQAVQAGLDMLNTLKQLNAAWAQQNWPVLSCGIGIHNGPALKAQIGSRVKMDTTLIGDTVNVASRLQAISRNFNTDFVISANTAKLIQQHFAIQPLGEVTLRGRRKPIQVFSVDHSI